MMRGQSLSRVFNIVADYEGLRFDGMIDRAQAVEKSVADLAVRNGVAIVFHEYAETMFGAPAILVEMPEDFADKVRGVAGVRDIEPPHAPTKARRI